VYRISERPDLTWRRPISRAEVDSLRSRLQSLESILRTQSGAGPSTDISLSALHDASSLDAAEPNGNRSSSRRSDCENPSLAAESEQCSNAKMNMSFSPDRRADSCSKSPNSSLVDIMSEGPSKVLIGHLISPSDSVLYDRSSGRLRQSCPIVALHQFSEMSPSNTTSGSREQNRRVERVLRELGTETHDHLLESFWSYYDSVMQVVDREVFEDDRKSGGGMTYSGFLHICILAMGYRYADAKRPDIQRLALENKESTLHREAKYLVEFEFEKPGGIPSVQALLILGQLESGSGRDEVGWMYAGTLFRRALSLAVASGGERLQDTS